MSSTVLALKISLILSAKRSFMVGEALSVPALPNSIPFKTIFSLISYTVKSKLLYSSIESKGNLDGI